MPGHCILFIELSKGANKRAYTVVRPELLNASFRSLLKIMQIIFSPIIVAEFQQLPRSMDCELCTLQIWGAVSVCAQLGF